MGKISVHFKTYLTALPSKVPMFLHHSPFGPFTL